MRVFVDSPHRLIQESLVAMIGQRHEVVEEAGAEIAVKDLCSYTFPYPDPPSLPTLALICSQRQEVIATEILRVGYRGYLRVEEGEQQLERALQALLRGENWAERHVIAALFDQRHLPSLTHRENEIYTLAISGLSNQEIAQRLGLSVNTIKVYVSKFLQKTQAKTRRELIIRATLKPQHKKD